MSRCRWVLAVAIALSGALAGCNAPEPEAGGGAGNGEVQYDPEAEPRQPSGKPTGPEGLAGEAGPDAKPSP